ncbi:MAG: type II toxin-antitoxin system PemK/MazF family toxin [Thermoanaerobaculia bacterium]
MPNTTSYKFGDIVLVPFPFADLTSTKQRPAVVVSGNDYNAEAVVVSENEHHDLIIVMGVTSVEGALGAADLKHWRQAGLRYPSAFKPIITTLAPSRVVRRLGKLSDEDRNRLKHLLVKVLNLVPSSASPAPPPS